MVAGCLLRFVVDVFCAVLFPSLFPIYSVCFFFFLLILIPLLFPFCCCCCCCCCCKWSGVLACFFFSPACSLRFIAWPKNLAVFAVCISVSQFLTAELVSLGRHRHRHWLCRMQMGGNIVLNVENTRTGSWKSELRWVSVFSRFIVFFVWPH